MTANDRSPIRVVGRYALYNEIAAGGMATIHLGRLLGPVGFARTVAIKRLHPQFAKDPEFVSMFLDEARLAARVQHPNVVATIDVVANEGELFLIMDYVRGESLSKVVRVLRKQNKLVPPTIAAAIMCGFLHGLHSAHEAKNERGEPLGLVHRDVSPQNVLVGSDGIARVLDFGIAKAAGRIQVTRDGQIKGKLAYMPPEQLSGREISRAVDIYASAVVMWEMLTGQRLFKGATERETLAKILREPVPPPTSVLPSLPPSFDAVLLKALNRDPAKRQATAKELALELERCCGVATATAVGEWVEETVGPVLNAREVQIAEIESSSVSMTIPTELTETSSDDISIPSVDAIRRAFEGAAGDTKTYGSGAFAASAGPPSSQRATVTAPLSSRRHEPVALPKPKSNPDDVTITRTRNSTLTMSLPVERRLPVIASMAGVAVLLVAVGIVLAGKYSNTSASHVNATSPTASIASANASAEPASSAASATATVAQPIPDPPATSDAPATPTQDDKPSASATASPSKSAAPVRSTPTTKATTPPPPPPPPGRANCDPPFTIDATGRKKYKRECI